MARLLKPALCGLLLVVLGALTYRQTGLYRDVETLWRATIARNPTGGMAFNNLGMLLLQRGGVNEAMYYLERAVTLSPKNAEARNNYGNALREKNRIEEAIAQFREAAALRPASPIYHANLGSAMALAGQIAGGIAQYEAAIALAPEDPFIANNLAWLLSTARDLSLRNGARAVEVAEAANRFSGGGNPTVLGTLAAAYAEAGRFEDSVSAASKAISAALAAGNAEQARAQTRLLEIYRSGRPFQPE